MNISGAFFAYVLQICSMKFFYLLASVLLISCSENIEDKCFIRLGDDFFGSYEHKEPYTVKQILNDQPDYLKIVDLKKYRTFKKDSTEAKTFNDTEETAKKDWETHQEDYKAFTEKFYDQFEYSDKQVSNDVMYALGRNILGTWLLKIDKGRASAYFLGLSFSHYYINKIQESPIVKDGFFQVEGSLVKIIKVPGLPGYDDYSAIEDGKLFKINLKDLMKDSDHDGYNDIFENSFGLDPENPDMDGDGINDFDDMNPMFKSEKNKFTLLYESLLPEYSGNFDFKKTHYFFEVYESDCDYFHQIDPNVRVLFIPEKEKRQTDYLRVTDVSTRSISKIKKDKTDPDKFYIFTSGSSYTNDYSAEFKNGKWLLKIVGGTVV